MEGDTYQPNQTGKEFEHEPNQARSKNSKKAGFASASQGQISESNHARSGVQVFELPGKSGQQMNTTGFHYSPEKMRQSTRDRIQEEELQENSSVER